jgi:GNAT superfamily N-acetyltransferase
LDQLILVAERGDAVIGFAMAKCISGGQTPFRNRRSVFLTDLAVRVMERRRGVGRALLDEVTSWARSMTADDVELECWSFNAIAQTFFERWGFGEVAKIRRKALRAP